MANITKTVQTELLAITAIASAAQQISSVQTVTTNLAATVFIDHAPDSATAPTKGTEYRIEVSEKASGNDTWRTLTSFVTGTVAANLKTVQATQNAGSTTITHTVAGTYVQDDVIFFKNGTIGNSEWSKVTSITSTTVEVILDGLTNAQGGSQMINKCEQFVAVIDCTAIQRFRVVVNNKYQAGTTIAIVARVACTTADSIA